MLWHIYIWRKKRNNTKEKSNAKTRQHTHTRARKRTNTHTQERAHWVIMCLNKERHGCNCLAPLSSDVSQKEAYVSYVSCFK